MSGETAADALLVASRLLWYAGVLVVIGASAFRLLVSRAAGPPAPERDRAAATAGLMAATVLIAGLLARLFAQTYAYFGVDEPMTLALLVEVATGLPPWSSGWLQQAAAAMASVAALAVAQAGNRAGWIVAHLAAVAVAASVPMTGHAVAQAQWYTLPIALQAGHVLGAGVWLGGLFMMLAVGVRSVPPAVRASEAGMMTIGRMVNAFSPVALGGAGLVVLTGGATALLYIGRIADLWTTTYGRALLVKLALVAAVAATGFVNWRRVRPRVQAPGGVTALRQTAALELALAGMVLAATALLVGLPQPGH